MFYFSTDFGMEMFVFWNDTSMRGAQVQIIVMKKDYWLVLMENVGFNFNPLIKMNKYFKYLNDFKAFVTIRLLISMHH